jgi:hypothetical protein
MKPGSLKIASILSVVMCLAAVIGPAAFAAPQIDTDKQNYNLGEPIRVRFADAPGLDSDWICIVPAGSPSTEAGDYKYMFKGQAQGVLTFDAPAAPGLYEARAYYNYAVKGYVAAARSAFWLGSAAEYEKQVAARQERMERRINPDNPLEASVPPDSGLVYIFREPWSVSSRADVELKANGKRIAVMPTKYFPYKVSAGDVTFSTGDLFDRNVLTGAPETSWYARASEARINVKPGYVYYIKVKVTFAGRLVPELEQAEYREGANLIDTYRLTPLQ